jgi:hypothetical protein
MIEREAQGKIEKILQRIRYRVYQGKIALACHDKEWLSELALKMRISLSKLNRIMKGKKVKKRKKSAGKRKDGRRKGSNRITKRNKKIPGSV